MQITRRNMLTAGVGALTVAAAPKAFAAWEPNDRYPDPAIHVLSIGYPTVQNARAANICRAIVG